MKGFYIPTLHLPAPHFKTLPSVLTPKSQPSVTHLGALMSGTQYPVFMQVLKAARFWNAFTSVGKPTCAVTEGSHPHPKQRTLKGDFPS